MDIPLSLQMISLFLQLLNAGIHCDTLEFCFFLPRAAPEPTDVDTALRFSK